MYQPNENIHSLEEFLKDKSLRVIGVVGDKNTGKSGLLFNIIDIVRKQAPETNIVGFRLSVYIPGVLGISTLIELSKIKNSLIILDELKFLADPDNRKDMKTFTGILQTIYHPYHNNTIILCGLAHNFNGKISGELDAVLFKQTTLISVIQRSNLDHMLKTFHDEGEAIKDDYMLHIPIDQALIYHPGMTKNWHVVDVPYLKSYDVKINNQPVIKWTDEKKKGVK
jgi:hypothetical protein